MTLHSFQFQSIFCPFSPSPLQFSRIALIRFSQCYDFVIFDILTNMQKSHSRKSFCGGQACSRVASQEKNHFLIMITFLPYTVSQLFCWKKECSLQRPKCWAKPSKTSFWVIKHWVTSKRTTFRIIWNWPENYWKCRIWIFEFWHFLPIFVPLKLTCLVILFDRKLQVF